MAGIAGIRNSRFSLRKCARKSAPLLNVRRRRSHKDGEARAMIVDETLVIRYAAFYRLGRRRHEVGVPRACSAEPVLGLAAHLNKPIFYQEIS